MDEEGVATLPVAGGKWFNEMHVGTHMLNYDSMLTLTHFKGHTMGGFGGSNKTWALAAPMAALEKAKSTLYLVLTTCGLSPKKS